MPVITIRGGCEGGNSLTKIRNKGGRGKKKKPHFVHPMAWENTVI